MEGTGDRPSLLPARTVNIHECVGRQMDADRPAGTVLYSGDVPDQELPSWLGARAEDNTHIGHGDQKIGVERLFRRHARSHPGQAIHQTFGAFSGILDTRLPMPRNGVKDAHGFDLSGAQDLSGNPPEGVWTRYAAKGMIDHRRWCVMGYPFPALLPFQVLHYPIPQALRGQPRTPWATWPGAMRPRVRRWKEQVSTPPSAGNQIYVHVPFCPFYCNFCPLYKTKDPRHRTEDIKEKYVATVLREIENYAKNPAVQGRKFRTLYFGGGTPTQLSPDQLGRIVDRIRTCLWLDDDTEITLEGVATQMLAPGYLESCREHGFNRISFGVQSLDPNVRRKVGRGEKPQDYERLVELVDDELPFNVDLMIGLPEQSLESHERDLKTILGWNVGSVDIYSYWMVPGTRTFEHVAAGRRSPPRYGQSLLEMRQLGKERLTGEGFRQISGEAYVRGDRDVFMQTTFGGGGNGLNTALGLGPSAIGFLDGTLYQNVADLDRYFEAIDDQVVPVQVAGRLDVATARRRAAVLGLQRLSVPRAVLGPRAASLFARWAGQGLLELRGDIYHLTSEGSLWYNQMQLALLTLTEQRKLVGLLGTPRQQAQALASHRAQPTDPTEQLLALIRDRGGVAGSLRVWGYKALVQLKRLPVFDQRAIGFSGPLQDRTRRSRTKEAR